MWRLNYTCVTGYVWHQLQHRTGMNADCIFIEAVGTWQQTNRSKHESRSDVQRYQGQETQAGQEQTKETEKQAGEYL